MKTAVRVALILLPVVMFWACQTEEVADVSKDVKTTEVIARLAASSSQAEAEAAVRSLIAKTEMGETFPGSRYESYTFSDEAIAELAELHTSYLNGELLPTLGGTFEAIMYVAGDIPFPRMEFDTAISMLAEETEAAFADPEEPGNALLVTIASEGGKIPRAAPSYNENTVRSPVQMVLFGLWFDSRFGGSRSISEADSAKLAPVSEPGNPCIRKCFKKYLIRVVWCVRRYPPGEKRDACIAVAAEMLEECLRDCHDQGKSSG